MAYGERLRELRAERQLSLRQVEERGGPNKDTMSLIERGEHKPRAQTLGRIAKAFDMSVAELRAELEAIERSLGEASPSTLEPSSNDVLEEKRRVKWEEDLRRMMERATALGTKLEEDIKSSTAGLIPNLFEAGRFLEAHSASRSLFMRIESPQQETRQAMEKLDATSSRLEPLFQQEFEQPPEIEERRQMRAVAEAMAAARAQVVEEIRARSA